MAATGIASPIIFAPGLVIAIEDPEGVIYAAGGGTELGGSEEYLALCAAYNAKRRAVRR